MTALERLNNDIKEAMKAKDKVRTQVLRMMLSEVKYAQSAVSMSQPLDEAAVLKCFASYHKKLTKSMDDFPAGEAKDAVAAEIKIVEDYLPKKASAAEVEAAIKGVMASTPDREFGVLMKQVLAKLGGGADGKIVSELLRKALG